MKTSFIPGCCGAIVIHGWNYVRYDKAKEREVADYIDGVISLYKNRGLIIVIINSKQEAVGIGDFLKRYGFRKADSGLNYTTNDINLYTYTINKSEQDQKDRKRRSLKAIMEWTRI